MVDGVPFFVGVAPMRDVKGADAKLQLVESGRVRTEHSRSIIPAPVSHGTPSTLRVLGLNYTVLYGSWLFQINAFMFRFAV